MKASDSANSGRLWHETDLPKYLSVVG
jgi:hypothetical protein